ncbi:Acetyl-coenzyme A carboxylase carboxyl transferase subunit beta 2 [Chytridiales sp. JEL 0842]|nr:Acetyl-coenzyme A carboxylase carboxyl transferase subunit beta 2 [Chytridiales sp. JEL 0842]
MSSIPPAMSTSRPIQPYPILKSTLQTNTPEYKSNLEAMLALCEDLKSKLQEATYQGRPKDIARHLKRGQLLARERVELLLDPDTPFLELLPLAGYGMDDMTIGGSAVAGIGLVNGVIVMITANIPTLAGGASNEISVQKGLRLHQIAVENRLPTISLTQTAGANLGQQSKVFHAGGAMFRYLAIRSKMNIPTCCVVFGSSTAGGAYVPGMSDYVIMVKGNAQVFLGGPPLVKMATGEIVDSESLGGASMHATKSGLADQLAQDELEAIRMARDWVGSLEWEVQGKVPVRARLGYVEEPFYDPDSIVGVVQANIRLPFESRDVIARLVDGSRFLDFKPAYGPNLITGWAHLHGFPIGIIANDSVFFPEESNKATQFIQLCNMRNTPILFLSNITGFMVGKSYEESGIIKAGARFINAVSNSQVPHLTVVIGASYGAGNYAMCGRAYAPRFMFSWPNSKCSVMGPDQLTGVMEIVMREAAAKSKRQLDEEMLTGRLEMFRSAVDAEQDVYYTSARCLDDGVIDPRQTRDILGMCLEICHGAEVKGGNLYGVSRM